MNTLAPAVTPFGEILKHAVESTPGAIGGAFADSQGELIDAFATYNRDEWAILTAHYGIVMANLRACFGTWHYGSPEYFIAQHRDVDIVVCVVEGGYYALLALTAPMAPLAMALATLRAASALLLKEMA